MPIITISRQLGSLGSDIAHTLAKELNCPILDKESLEEYFKEHGVSNESVERFDEKKPGFWDLFKSDKAKYLHFMKGAILKFACNNNGIILGRGGQVLLSDFKGILNVRVIAPMDVRIKRVIEKFNCDENQATQIISNNDSERSGFHKFFFGANWEDLEFYNIVINTGFFSAETATKIIKDMAESPEIINAQPEVSKKLADLCLEHMIKTALIYNENLVIQFLEVVAEDGNVTLRGIVDNKDDLERSASIVKNLPGIKNVINEIYYSPFTATSSYHY